MGIAGNNLSIASKVMMGANLFQNYFSSRGQAEAEADAIIAQGKQAIKSMNYSFMNFEIERKNAFESAVNQLGAIRLQARGLEASVANAVEERMGDGKTAQLLKRSTRAEGQRASTQIKQNFISKAGEIDLNKESTFLSTKQYLDGLETPKIPNLIAGIWQGAGQALDYYNKERNMQNLKSTRVGTGESTYRPSINALSNVRYYEHRLNSLGETQLNYDTGVLSDLYRQYRRTTGEDYKYKGVFNQMNINGNLL